MSAVWTADDPGVGDPDGLRRLARQFGETADEGRLAQARLVAVARDAADYRWSGAAVAALRDRIEGLPPHLAKMVASYEAAADATRAYAAEVGQIAVETASVKVRLALAEQDHVAAVAVQSTWSAPVGLPGDDRDPLVVARERAIGAAVADSEAQLRFVASQLAELVERRQVADDRMLAGLVEAGRLGMHNASGWSHAWQRVSTDVSHWTENVVHTVDDAVQTTVGVVEYYRDHPDQLRQATVDVAEIVGGALLSGGSIGGDGLATAGTGGIGAIALPAAAAGAAAGAGLMYTGAKDLGDNLNHAVADSDGGGGVGPSPEITDEDVDADLLSRSISEGHSYAKHVIKQAEYAPGTTQQQFKEIIEDTIKTGEKREGLNFGRKAYWKDGTVVIIDRRHQDGGTAFRPSKGHFYFEDIE